MPEAEIRDKDGLSYAASDNLEASVRRTEPPPRRLSALTSHA